MLLVVVAVLLLLPLLVVLLVGVTVALTAGEVTLGPIAFRSKDSTTAPPSNATPDRACTMYSFSTPSSSEPTVLAPC